MTSFRFTFLYMIVTAAGLNILGFLAALALNRKLKLRNVLRAAYFLPMVICGVSVGYIWNVIVVRLFPNIGVLLGSELLQKNWLSIFNDFSLPMILISSRDMRTIPLAISSFFGTYLSDWNLIMAALTVSIIPVLIFFFAFQKNIMSGLAEGALKG